MGRKGSGTRGRALAALCLFVFSLVVLFAGFAFGAGSPPVERRLVYVDTDIWDSDLLITSYWGEKTIVRYDNWKVGPFPTPVTLSWGETRRIENFAQYQDGAVGLARVQILEGDATLVTSARFADNEGNVAQFDIPALRHKLGPEPGALVEARFIQSDDEFETSLTLFNDSPYSAPMTATIYDEKNQFVANEHFEVGTGPYTLYQLKARVPIGRVELRQGWRGFGCPGCVSSEGIYGFAAVNWRGGGSPRIYPFGPLVVALSK